MAGDVPPLISTSEAAMRLGVSESTIRKNCAKGKIPSIQTDGGHYRIPEEWVDKEVEKQNQKIKLAFDRLEKYNYVNK